jgi:hypothetical protein
MEQVQVRLPISRYTPTEFQVTGGSHPELQVYGERVAVALTAAGDEDGVLDEQDAAAAEALMQAATEYRNAVRARIADRQPG